MKKSLYFVVKTNDGEPRILHDYAEVDRLLEEETILTAAMIKLQPDNRHVKVDLVTGATYRFDPVAEQYEQI